MTTRKWRVYFAVVVSLSKLYDELITMWNLLKEKSDIFIRNVSFWYVFVTQNDRRFVDVSY